MTLIGRISFLLLPFLLLGCSPEPRINPLSASVSRSLTISGVDINTQAAAFESERARDYSSRLAADLRAALRREFSDRLSPAGARLRVEVARLNVADSASSAFGRDQSALQGLVQVVEPGTERVLANYAMDVRAGQAAESRTGAIFSTVFESSGGYYRELVDDFAEQTATRVLD